MSSCLLLLMLARFHPFSLYPLRINYALGLLMAYIHKHLDGWRAQVAKMRVRKTSVWATKREATEWASRLEAEIAAGQHREKTNQHTFSDLADKYLEDVTSQKRGQEWEKRRIESFRVSLSGNLADIDTPNIVEWRDKRLKTVSASTVVREANILRNMFNVAVNEWRWMERNPFTGMKLPRENPARKSIWTWQLIRRVLRARTSGKTREAVLAFHLSLRTGMRLQEVLAAPENYDEKRKVVTVKTKGAARGEEIPIGRLADKMLKKVSFTAGPNEASVLFSKLCRNLLIKGLTFHDARATALTHLSKKVDVLTLGKISRHKDLNLLLNTYYRTTAEDISKLI